MAQFVKVGMVDIEQGFVTLTQVIGGLRGNNSWCVSVYRRDPTAIFGIREYAGRDYLAGCDDATANAFFDMVSGEGHWEKNYRCAAKIAQDLGWC